MMVVFHPKLEMWFQELEQRYTRFRVEVQTALDRCESGATYASLAKRVISREASETNALGTAPSTRPTLVKKPTPTAGHTFTAPHKQSACIYLRQSCMG